MIWKSSFSSRQINKLSQHNMALLADWHEILPSLRSTMRQLPLLSPNASQKRLDLHDLNGLEAATKHDVILGQCELQRFWKQQLLCQVIWTIHDQSPTDKPDLRQLFCSVVVTANGCCIGPQQGETITSIFDDWCFYMFLSTSPSKGCSNDGSSTGHGETKEKTARHPDDEPWNGWDLKWYHMI